MGWNDHKDAIASMTEARSVAVRSVRAAARKGGGAGLFLAIAALDTYLVGLPEEGKVLSERVAALDQLPTRIRWRRRP
jgi:hypothetical protein